MYLSLCLSKETAVWISIGASEYDVANQQFVNIITFNNFTFDG